MSLILLSRALNNLDSPEATLAELEEKMKERYFNEWMETEDPVERERLWAKGQMVTEVIQELLETVHNDR